MKYELNLNGRTYEVEVEPPLSPATVNASAHPCPATF